MLLSSDGNQNCNFHYGSVSMMSGTPGSASENVCEFVMLV